MANCITEDTPQYRPLGRYVCDDRLTECHLFDTVVAARGFAKTFGKDCNIGWLAPVYDRRTGKTDPLPFPKLNYKYRRQLLLLTVVDDQHNNGVEIHACQLLPRIKRR